jgi:hypothetical protein
MGDATARLDAALLGLDGFVVVATAEVGGELELLVETTADLVGCPRCGAVARAKDRRPTWVRDLPLGGRQVVLCWWKRVWCCPHPLCEVKTWTERHPAIAPRACLTERARQPGLPPGIRAGRRARRGGLPDRCAAGGGLGGRCWTRSSTAARR